VLSNEKPIAFISEVYLHHRLCKITGAPLGKVSADHGRFGRACVFVGVLVVVFACAAWLFVVLTKQNVRLFIQRFVYVRLRKRRG